MQAALATFLAAATPLLAGEAFAPRLTPGDEPARITGRIVDGEGHPLAGARIEALAPPRAGYRGLFRSPEPAVTVTSDAEGHFALDPGALRVRELRVRDDAGRVGHVPAAAAGDFVTLPLAPASRLVVELVERASGRPIAGVPIAVQWTEKALLRQFTEVRHTLATARSDARGHAVFEGLAPGLVEIAVEPGARGLAPARSWRVLAGDSRTLRLPVSEPPRTVRGRVTDRAGGAVPSARLALDPGFEHAVGVDAQARFAFTTLVPLGELRLFAAAEGFALEEHVVADPLGGGTENVIALPPGRAVHGTLVDERGHPLPGVPIAVVNDPFVATSDLVRGTSGPDGAFGLHGLRVDVKHVLVAERGGSALLVRSLTDAEFGAPDLDLGTLAFAKGVTLTGTFLDAGGLPVAGAEVSCSITPPERAGQATRSNLQPFDIPIGSVRTDSRGRFRFDDLPEGVAALAAVSAHTMKRETVALDPRKGSAEVVIRSLATLRAPDAAQGEIGGTLSARILQPDGVHAAAGAHVDLLPEDDTADPTQSTFADERGQFTFREIQGGRYRLSIELRSGFAGVTPLWARARLRPDELALHVARSTGPESPAIRLLAIATVKGRVVAARETEPRPWFLRVAPDGPLGVPISVATDAQGRFEFPIESGATFTAFVQALPREPGAFRSALGAEVPVPIPMRGLLAGSEELVINVP